MRKLIALLLFALSFTSIAYAAPVDAGLIQPPVLSIPAGGKTMADLNISDSDVLGMVKGILPMLTEGMRSMAAAHGVLPEDLPKELNFTPFIEAISGVKNIRVVTTKYNNTSTTEKILREAGAGVAKMGQFNRIATEAFSLPPMISVYAQADNGGYVAYLFDSQNHTLYAARLVGSIDIAKLTKWLTDMGASIAVKSETAEAK